jgi:hypothetical protein
MAESEVFTRSGQVHDRRVHRQSIGQDHRDGGPERGYDGGKKIKGRKRHLLVETLGWLLAVLITSARLADGVAAPLLLSHVMPQDLPRLVTIFADQKYHNHALDGHASDRVAHRGEGTARGHTRLHTAGETLGD